MLSENLAWQIESVEQKLQRAHHHLQDLKNRLPRGPQHYEISRELQADGLTEIFTFHEKERPSPELSAIAGDFINNAWNALNHIAMALHIARSGVPTRREEARIAYPLIVDTNGISQARAEFKAFVEKHCWGIHPEAITIMETNQPYNTGNGAFRWLYELARIDRHRKLNLPYHMASGVSSFSVPDGVWLDALGGTSPIEDGAVIARLRWNTRPDTNMYFHFLCEIAFSDGQRTEQVTTIADWIFRRVGKLRDDLALFYAVEFT